MSALVIAAVAVLLGFLLLLKHRRRNRKLKLPPSPPSLPLLGHLHLIGRLPHRCLHALHLRYGRDGSGLLLLQLGRRRTLVVSTAAAAADVFKNLDLAFASRPYNAAAHKHTYGSRTVSFAPYGEYWRRAKKVAVVHLLSPRRVEALAAVRAAEVAALVARAAGHARRGEAVELRELLYGYTHAVVTRATTGATGMKAERLKQLLGNSSVYLAGFQADDVLPDAAARLVTWATGLEKKIDGVNDEWDKFLSQILAEHKEKTGEGDFMDVLLRLREEEEEDAVAGFELTDDGIKAITKDMIAAGTETTAVTLEWAMAELVANPRVMTKLQDEIAQVTGGGEQPAVAEAELCRMEYLTAVIKEVLRLHPPAPLLLPHESREAAVVQGSYVIPAKTVVFINAWAIGRDPTAWEAPEEFRPERFMAGAPRGEVDLRGCDYQLIPFGAGRRVCPGINFALPIVELALVGLLCNFDWSLPAGVRPADLDMGEAPGLTTPPQVPLVLIPKCKALA